MVRAFLDDRGEALNNVIHKTGFARNAAIVACKEVVNQNDESRKHFEVMCREVFKKFKACINVAEKLRVDHWRDKEATRDAVRLAIRDYLWDENTGLPIDTFAEEDVDARAEDVFRHIYRAYPTMPSPYDSAQAMV